MSGGQIILSCEFVLSKYGESLAGKTSTQSSSRLFSSTAY